jgi:MoaA/NifB/PqqE/SkfB family radical SAM enzyme
MKTKFLRNQTPWVFVIEIVHGCNLACGHCAMAVLDRTPKSMTLDTWRQTMEIIATVNPQCRVELAIDNQ